MYIDVFILTKTKGEFMKRFIFFLFATIMFMMSPAFADMPAGIGNTPVVHILAMNDAAMPTVALTEIVEVGSVSKSNNSRSHTGAIVMFALLRTPGDGCFTRVCGATGWKSLPQIKIPI